MAVKKQQVPKPNVVFVRPLSKLETYGMKWTDSFGKPVTNQFVIECTALLMERGTYAVKNKAGKWCLNPKGLKRWEHCKNIIDMLWNYPGSKFPFHWHAWAIRMVQVACRYKNFTFAGSAGCGKSQVIATLGYVFWLASPHNTKVILTSTSLKDSRGRIWGYLEKLHNHCIARPPGELVSSQGLIRYVDPVTGVKDDMAGLSLLAGEKSAESESLGKLIGFHNHRVILLCDELQALSATLIEAAESNLAQNPVFIFGGIGNPTSYYDPLGRMAEPENGWSSVSINDKEWQGKRSYVCRFDGEDSPALSPEGAKKYPYLLTAEKLANYRLTLGEASMRFASQVRAWWHSSTGRENIYTPIDLITYRAHDKAVWASGFTRGAGLDLGFTLEGDSTVLTIGAVGLTTDGAMTVEVQKTFYLNEDIGIKEVSRTQQIVEQVRDILAREGVPLRNLAIDTGGGGDLFADTLQTCAGSGFIRCKNNHTASDAPISGLDRTPANELVENKITELYLVGQSLLRSGQLKGIGPNLAKELVARELEDRGKKLRVTPKPLAKAKLGYSPDEADSFHLLLEAFRQRHGLAPGIKSANAKKGETSPAKKKFRELQNIYAA